MNDRGRLVYEALPNDENDKRAYGSWKVCVREYDADGRMVRTQKYAQEIYREDHAKQIAAALNLTPCAVTLMAAIDADETSGRKLPGLTPEVSRARIAFRDAISKTAEVA